MRRGSGYIRVLDPELGDRESDCFTCSHCQKIVEVPPMASAKSLGWCRRCDKPICETCTDVGTCVPFEKRVDEIERRDRLYREMRE